jgi:serine/threonine protein kinase
MPSCPACGTASSPGNRFCGACGAPLGVDPSLTRTTPPDEQLPVRIVAGPVPTPPMRTRFASDADGLAPGTVVAGRYRVVNLVGQGGMGEVYRADDLTLGHPVALKFLPRNLDPHSDRFARFLAEVRTARQVSHPNVCRVYDIVQSEGRTFLAMEYVDGEDLSSLLRRIGRLPSDKAIEIARQLCAGLAAAHDKGVLHRDLKPANVMLDSRGRARLTDFGLAGAEDADLDLAGTPAYMAPEQLRGEPASMRSEVYALGLVLYELFTGRRLFDASSIAALRDLHDRTDVAALSTGVDGGRSGGRSRHSPLSGSRAGEAAGLGAGGRCGAAGRGSAGCGPRRR